MNQEQHTPEDHQNKQSVTPYEHPYIFIIPAKKKMQIVIYLLVIGIISVIMLVVAVYFALKMA